jgi:hypothetical protein
MYVTHMTRATAIIHIYEKQIRHLNAQITTAATRAVTIFSTQKHVQDNHKTLHHRLSVQQLACNERA